MRDMIKTYESWGPYIKYVGGETRGFLWRS